MELESDLLDQSYSNQQSVSQSNIEEEIPSMDVHQEYID